MKSTDCQRTSVRPQPCVAVLGAYGRPYDLTDEEILERLLELMIRFAQACFDYWLGTGGARRPRPRRGRRWRRLQEPAVASQARPIFTVESTADGRVKAYISWYSDGVLILDITDPYNPVEVARYLDNTANESGDPQNFWGVYKIGEC